MSLPEFKFTNLTKPTNNTAVNSGLSSKDKMVKSGIIPNVIEKVQDTASSLKSRVSDMSSSAWSGITNASSSVLDNIEPSSESDGSGSFFSFTFIIKLILIVVILWFMWSNLANHGDFHLGMDQLGYKITSFFNTMEDKGRELVAKISGKPVPPSSSASAAADAARKNNAKDGVYSSDSASDSDSEEDEHDRRATSGAANGNQPRAPHRAPVPPSMNNSSNKKPGFNNDDTRYTFLDKAARDYSGPSPNADDSTSVTQKHQSGKAGYCYIGEDRGFRTCARVEAGDKCMSGQVYSRQEICIDPTLRE